MKRLLLVNILFLLAFLVGTFSAVSAQVDGPPPQGNQFVENRRPNLMQALGLTRDQIQQLRQMNANLQPQAKEAQRRHREATQALDEAIYADEINESMIQERMKEVQLAQAEVIKNRTMMETAVRKILTRDQLYKFRQLRQQFMQKPRPGEGNPKQRLNQPKRPLPKRLGRPAV